MQENMNGAVWAELETVFTDVITAGSKYIPTANLHVTTVLPLQDTLGSGKIRIMTQPFISALILLLEEGDCILDVMKMDLPILLHARRVQDPMALLPIKDPTETIIIKSRINQDLAAV